MWKIVGGMKYWCDPMCLILHFAVRVQVLSGLISQKYTWRKVPAKCAWSLVKKKKSFFFIIEHLITVHGLYYSILHTHKNVISAVALHSLRHSVSFPLLHPSSSQVGIHHHVGGQLTSDSFVNVNYCSLSEPRESGTCRAVRRQLKRTQNNQPMCLWFPHHSFHFGRPSHSSKHANLTLCMSHLPSDQTILFL